MKARFCHKIEDRGMPLLNQGSEMECIMISGSFVSLEIDQVGLNCIVGYSVQCALLRLQVGSFDLGQYTSIKDVFLADTGNAVKYVKCSRVSLVNEASVLVSGQDLSIIICQSFSSQLSLG